MYFISFYDILFDFLFELSDIAVWSLFMWWFGRIYLVFNCFVCYIVTFWLLKDFTTTNAEVQDSFRPEPVQWEVSCTPFSTCWTWLFAGKIISSTSFLNSFNPSITLSPQIWSPYFSKIQIEFSFVMRNGLLRLILHW